MKYVHYFSHLSAPYVAGFLSLSCCRAYSGRLVPQLVFSCDESTLNAVCQSLECSMSSMLKASLPSCMVLILTCWAQEQEEGREEKGDGLRVQAANSHELLCKHMSEEVRRM